MDGGKCSEMSPELKLISKLESLLLSGKPTAEDVTALPDYEMYLLYSKISTANDVKLFIEHLPNNPLENIEGEHHEHQQLRNMITGLALLKLYIMLNYTGPKEPSLDTHSTDWLKALYDKIDSQNLVLDGEYVCEMTAHPLLLVLVSQLLNTVCKSKFSSILWWQARLAFLHQRILGVKSSVLWKHMESLGKNAESYSKILESSDLKSVFYSELSSMYLFHYHLTKGKEFAEKAVTSAGINWHFKGVMGRRTKFQQHDVPQLILEISQARENASLSDESEEFVSSKPENVALDDELRLESIEAQTQSVQDYSPIQGIALLSGYTSLSKSYPTSDEVAIEQRISFLSAMLTKRKNWSTSFKLLFDRCGVENRHSRTVERAMKQLETLLKSLSSEEPCFNSRYYLFFGSMCPAVWELEECLADSLFSLGCHQSALDIYKRLCQWEKIVQCYNQMELRHKAAEVINEEISVNGESVKLLVALGDATSTPENYEKAWILSNCRSSLAQARWGYFYYYKNDFENAIPHFEKAVELNPLENPVWLRLGYSALQIENWDLCVKAYKHSCILDSDNFQSWNNLAKAYTHLGELTKALRTLKEATRCDFGMWKLWDNILKVAVGCASFDDGIHAYGRLLDLKDDFVDEKSLSVMVSSIHSDRLDSNGEKCIRYKPQLLKLFGKITAKSSRPLIWRLYSDLVLASQGENISTEDLYKAVSFNQKCMRFYMQDVSWVENLEEIEAVKSHLLSLLEKTEEYARRKQGADALTQATDEMYKKATKLIERQASGSQQLCDILDELKKSKKTFSDISAETA